MEPGRNLDELIAQKIFEYEWRDRAYFAEYGWHLEGDRSLVANGFDISGYQKGNGFNVIKIFHTRPYSTDIAAAWTVVEKLQKTHAVCIEKAISAHGFTVWFVPGPSRGDGFHSIESIMEKFGATSCSVPHAIALAALKSVSKTESGKQP